jgi:UDP-N-acetylglucosamine diphosphorylase/glucosamine-1-phosphate N-acetyltransferase
MAFTVRYFCDYSLNPSAMNLILFDDPLLRLALLPFTFTRPVGKIRVGILTIQEKWEKRLNTSATFRTEEYLQKKFPVRSAHDNLLVNGALCPDDALADTIKALPAGYYLVKDNVLLAASQPSAEMRESNIVRYEHDITLIDKPWKIFKENAAQIKADFGMLTAGRKSAPITDPYTRTYKAEDIFLEEGVDLKAATLNAESGPIYLGKNSVVQEGAVVRGSFSLGEGAMLNMGAKVRGDTTIGPFCKVGGEISNSVIFAYSNKAHDGFLGNSVLGEWCNLGADTNSSNMKNTYDTTKLWNHAEEKYEKTGLTFCGLMMGDHGKSGINTMFNTATVVDPFSTVFGEGYPRTYIPAFSWGGAHKFETNLLSKAIETAARVMERRNVVLTEQDKEIITHVFHLTKGARTWENQL